MSTLYEKLDERLDGPFIRLLTLLPSTNLSDDICCELSTRTIGQCPEFDALSYCWGGEGGSPTIQCNGSTLKVTENLDDALRYLRHPIDPHLLWIDAICINQQDNDEKGRQVLLMGDIYSQAAKTYIWLGDLGSSITKGRDPASVLEDESPMFHSPAPEPMLPSADSVDTELEPRVVLLGELLSHPWFTRVWIIQELCLSRCPLILVGMEGGSFTIPWSTFMKAHSKALSEVAALRPLAFPMSWESLVSAILATCVLVSRAGQHMRSLRIMRSEFTNTDTSQNLELLDLLCRFRVFDSTNSKDKVYSLLGLVGSEHRPDILPDYTTSTSQCYADAAFSIIKSSSNLDLFNIPPFDNSSRDEALPSWAPHWNNESVDSGDVTGLLDLKYVQHMFREELAVIHKQFLAGHYEGVLTLRRCGSSDLFLSGYPEDEISDVKGQLKIPVPEEFLKASIWAWPAWNTTTNTGDSTFSRVLITVGHGHWLSRLRKLISYGILGAQTHGSTLDVVWHQLVQSFCQSYPTRDDFPALWYALITYGQEPGARKSAIPSSPNELLLPWNRAFPGAGLWRCTAYRLRATVPRFYLFVLGLWFFFSMLVRLTATIRVLLGLGRAWEHRMAATVGGLLALVPAETGVGDKVALLAGGKTPYVVRRCAEDDEEGSRWQLVGACYVFGIMYGGAWDQDKVGDMHFI